MFCQKHLGEKLEPVQKAALATTSAIHGTSRDKIYQELRLESLISGRRYKRLSCIFKIMKEDAPNYLINLIPKCAQNIRIRIIICQPTNVEKVF